MTKILFCGDIVISHPEKFIISDAVTNYIRQHDFAIFNLEGAFKEINDKSLLKVGPHISNSICTLSMLKKAGFNVAALANNHIMDYGAQALERTINILKDNGFNITGAGMSYEEAYKPLYLEKENEKVCIINAAQAEFGVLKTDYEGIGYAWIGNPIIKNIIKQNKELGYKMIFFLHCGLEAETVPLVEWVDIYHKLVDVSDACLIATHPHIIQGKEKYKGKSIYYSLGNFLFEKNEKYIVEEWNRGLIVSIDTEKKREEYKCIVLNNGILDFNNTEGFLKDFEERSKILNDRKQLERMNNKNSIRYWEKMYSNYYSQLIEDEKIGVVIKYVLKGLIKKILRRKLDHDTLLLHNLQIETHRWIVERYLYNQNKDYNEI